MAIAGFALIGVAISNQPLIQVVVAEILPLRWRGAAQIAPLSSTMIGSVAGLFIGAALNRNSDPGSEGFRDYSYMAMACYFVSAVVCAAIYNPPPLPTQTQFTLSDKLRKLDWWVTSLPPPA
jgi:hypothetical protein